MKACEEFLVTETDPEGLMEPPVPADELIAKETIGGGVVTGTTENETLIVWLAVTFEKV